nr:hypothetical protein [Tanacetum cinerariifolium]
MSSFSSLGIRLCVLFGILLVLALVAEVCYLLWWKKKTEDNQEDIENQNFSPSKKSPLYFFCFKTTTSSRNILNQPNNLQNCLKESDDIKVKEQEPTSKDLQVKCLDEESLDVEIMRLHNLCGPPRFLTTINEETKEDMEVDSIKGSRTMSLSDVSSPLRNTQYLNMEGFLNPLYDFEAHEFDFSKFRSSPPPTFKFMRDAEEKLLRRLIAFEAQKRSTLVIKQEEKEGSFLNLGGNKGKSEDVNLHHNHNQISTPSQVLPFAYSPLEWRVG